MYLSIDRFETAVAARVLELTLSAEMTHTSREWRREDLRVTLEPLDPTQGILRSRSRDYAPSWSERVHYDERGVECAAKLIARAFDP